MQGNTFDLQTIEEVSTNVVKQHGGSWHKVRNAVVEFIYIVIWVTSHVHQFAFPSFGFLPISNRLNAILVSHLQLHIIQVGKALE